MCPVGDFLETKLGGGFKYFSFSTLFGEMIHFNEHIFQMGWFNHQPEKFNTSNFEVRDAI